MLGKAFCQNYLNKLKTNIANRAAFRMDSHDSVKNFN